MKSFEDTLHQGFLAECSDQLITLETELIALEKGGDRVDPERAERAFRLMHPIRGGASFLDLNKIADLAKQTEDALELVRSRAMIPTPENFTLLLRATDKLHDMIRDPSNSDDVEIGDLMMALLKLPEQPSRETLMVVPRKPLAGPRPLRVLLVEDDFTSRLVLQTFLSRYGDCHIAVNGREAVEAVRIAGERGQIYDLICMDIMMPEMDGREAVRQVRALEESCGIFSTRGAKITMTTTVGDIKKVFQCFKELCDAYLVKPIDRGKLLSYMEIWGMVG